MLFMCVVAFAPIFLLLVPGHFDKQWHPNISVVQQSHNSTVIITVTPIVDDISYLELCLRGLGGMNCNGNVFPVEAPEDALRYTVTGLACNLSYYVLIRPHSKDGKELDIWIHKKDPFYVAPCPASSTVLPSSSSAAPVNVMVSVVFIMVFIAVAFIICYLHNRGYIKKLWFWKCCLPQAESPVRLFQLYMMENESFHMIVKKHLAFLQCFFTIDCIDYSPVRDEPRPDEWLEEVCADRRVIIYVSPQLLAAFKNTGNSSCQQDPALISTLARKFVQLINSLTAKTTLVKRQGRPIFILSGCFSSDWNFEQYLQQDKSLKSLKCYWITHKDNKTLNSPELLLAKLSGCHVHCHGNWSNSVKAEELQNAIRHFCCVADTSSDMSDYLELNEQRHEMEDMPMLPNDYKKQRHLFTDSGISSDVDHKQKSSPDSQKNCIPGIFEEAGFFEADSMEQFSNIYCNPQTSASQTLLEFQPPDPVDAGEVDSIIIDQDMMSVNTRGDWS